MASSDRSSAGYLRKLAAAFTSAREARNAAVRLSAETGVPVGRIRVVGPNDPPLACKLDPKSSGVARALLQPRVALGMTGLALGLLIGLAFVTSATSALSFNPWSTVSVLGACGAFGGFILVGPAGLPPEQAAMIAWLREAAAGSRWLVLVHIRNRHEEQQIRRSLQRMSGKVFGCL